MKRRHFLSTSAIAGAATAASTLPAPAIAQSTFTWRMAVLYPRGISFGVAYEAFAERVAEMSDGRLTIENVYDGEGVGATEIFGATRSGLVEMGSPYMALHAGELPAGLVELGLPGGPTRYDELYALRTVGGWGEILTEAYAEQGLHWLGPIFQPGVYAITKQEIGSLADFEGLQMRSPGAYGEFVAQFGVNPVTMAFSEMYTSLATGVIDGAASSNIIDYRDAQVVEQAPWLYPEPVSGSQAASVIINANAWASLPADLQAVLSVAQIEHCWGHAQMSIAGVGEALNQMREQGLQMSPAPSAEDRAAWAAAAETVQDSYAEGDAYSRRLVEAQRAFMARIG
ncbi:MAG: TRAP transporter substrate-binding protein DctP [Azospirillaceae bacterium]